LETIDLSIQLITIGVRRQTGARIYVVTPVTLVHEMLANNRSPCNKSLEKIILFLGYLVTPFNKLVL